MYRCIGIRDLVIISLSFLCCGGARCMDVMAHEILRQLWSLSCGGGARCVGTRGFETVFIPLHFMVELDL